MGRIPPIDPTDGDLPDIVVNRLAARVQTPGDVLGDAVASVGGSGTVFFGSDVNTARPVSSSPIVWVGYTGFVPANAEDNDLVFTSDAPSAGGGALPLAFQQAAIDTANLTSYSFASQPIGTADAARRVIVGAVWSSDTAGVDRTLVSATIGGVAATVDVDSGAITGDRHVVLLSAVVPTGTTATVALQLSGTATRAGIGVWTVGGSPTGQTAVSKNLDSGSLTVTTVSGQAVVCVGTATDDQLAAVDIAWTGATERYDAQIENTYHHHSGADVVATGTSTVVSYSTNGNDRRGFVAAAYTVD